LPKIAWVASIVAFLLAGGAVLSALTGQIVFLAVALIPLAAGIGIVRKRAWAAYGYALFQLAQLALVPVILFRSGGTAAGLQVIGTAVLMLLLIPLFFFAGRSLSATGSERGRAWPWILLSVLTTAPLLFVEAFVMPSASMEDTLLVGDRFFVQRFPKPTLGRGDIVAFAYPVDRRQSYIKRVIGIPGDRIRISRKIVYRNGAEIHEPYVRHITDYMDSYRDNFPSEPNTSFAAAAHEMLTGHVVNGEVVVPEGKYFVLGDNRDDSLDSRYWGFVSYSDVIGKPLLIYDSEDLQPGESLGGTPARAHRIRWYRLFKVL
jgi:signal peptidase I